MYKISDKILTEEQFHYATCTINGFTAPIASMWNDGLANGYIICREDITAIMEEPSLCAVRAENVNMDGTSIVFPEPGIYSFNSGDGNYFSRIETTYTVIEKKKVIHHLDPKYIKDMYYSTSNVKETVLVDNLTLDSYHSGDVPQCNFIPGQKYSVIWNGTRYDNLICVFSGEYNIITGESVPFYIDDTGGDALYIEPEFETVTIIQFKEDEEIHHIAEKYIPDTIVRASEVVQADWNKTDETSPDYIKNKPFGDNSDGTVTKMDNKYLPDTIIPNTLILNSSTEGSTKKFKVTVDDSGTISAVEVQ